MDFQSLSVEASDNRPDLASIEKSNRFLEKGIEIQKTDLRPRLDFFGSYGWSAIDRWNFGTKRERISGFSASVVERTIKPSKRDLEVVAKP